MKITRFPRTGSRGFSLIELMITIIISLLASIAVFGVLSTYEGKKRSTTFVNDALQAGTYGMFYIDKLVRNAGSGFVQTWATSYGCQLKGYNSAAPTTTIFPTSALSPEFNQVQTDSNGKFVLAPVLIDYQGSIGGTSDALIVMSGNAGNAEFASPFTAVPSTSAAIPLQNTVPYQPSDLLVLTDQSGATQAPCLLSQVSSTFNRSTSGSATAIPLPLAGTFYQASSGGTQVVNYSSKANSVDLGNPTSDSAPAFEVIGVSANRVLVDYSLLGATGTANQVADGVLEMHALYGIDETGAGQITNWVSPSAAGFTFATLINQAPGTAGSPGTGAYLLERIKAIRVGLILRTDLPENTKNTAIPITVGPITLFSTLGIPSLTYTRTLTTAETGYRYRTVEATIPVRNNLLIAQ